MESFVIFGMGRTGSSLLATLLNSHPQIRCKGELFRPGRWRRLLQPLVKIWRRYPLPHLAYRHKTHVTKPWSRPYSEIVVNYAELLADDQAVAGLSPLSNLDK